MRTFLQTAVRCTLAAGLAVTVTLASAKEMIKVGTFVPAQSVGVAKVIKPWMDAVSQEVGDEVGLKGFWGGTLGKSPFKQFELTRNGVIDVSWVLPGYTAGQFPEMGLFELPFLFQTAEEASVVGWRLHEMGMLSGFDGVHVIGFCCRTQRLVHARKGCQPWGFEKQKNTLSRWHSRQLAHQFGRGAANLKFG